MKTPPHQRLIRWAGWVLAGILALGTLLDALSNAISLVTPSVAITGSIFLLGGWLLVETVLKRRPSTWRGVDGSEQRIKTFGPQPRLFVVGMVLLLWFPSVLEWARGVPRAPEVSRQNAPTPEQPKQAVPPPSSEPKKVMPPKEATEQVPSAPYPWISANGTQWGDPPKVMLTMTVREYPPRREQIEKSAMSILSLFSVYATVITHVRLVKEQGEDQCGHDFRHPEFRNELHREAFMGAIPLEREVTPISFRISARNGTWNGYILLRRHPQRVDYEQVSRGFVINADGSKRRFTVKEARYDNKLVRDPNLPDQLDRDMLLSFGVPMVGVDRPPTNCPNISLNQ